nr:carboxypeptidase regulatory-like domain-containing protein [uncultured Chitinophaga sp.]
MKLLVTNFYRQPVLLLVVLLITVTAQRIRAQETSGGLQGRITNAAGEALPGAAVIAIHQPSGTRYGVSTFNDGRFLLTGMRIGGPYLLEVNFMGMEKESRLIPKVSLGEPAVITVVLRENTKQLKELVVTGGKTARANTYGAGTHISRQQLRQVPTIGRSLTDITRTVPQSSKDNSFAGTNFRYNNVTIDGAINNDAIGFSPSTGGQTGTSNMPGSSTRTNPVSLDAIEDMQVYLAPYDVKIGNFTGGSINAVTKSGTNEVHGSLYAYGRNSSLVGPDRTGTELEKKMPSSFYDYQTGISAGFPIIRNKLFFFTNEEITRRQDPTQQVAGSVAAAGILDQADADNIRSYLLKKYNFDPGTAGVFNTTTHSNKFFNRIDWNISDKHQLILRNNTIRSGAVHMDRDQFSFRFGSIAYEQTNNQSSSVLELKSRLSNRVSNSLLIGYTNIHDYRTPLSDAAFPQVQIVGKTPGTTIFLGTDREASIFNLKQRTLEFTDNITWSLGRHTLSAGTHNEFYNIGYGFVNGWNGRVTYQSINDFLSGKPQRVQGNFNYTDNSREYQLAHPAARFNINFLSAYIQDEIRISDRFRITPGLRIDYTYMPQKQELSDRAANAITDPDFGNTYTYTPLRMITRDYLSKPQLSPRLGFRALLNNEQSLVLRGGVGMFTGRIPLAWLGYAYYNTGSSYGSIDLRTDGNPPSPYRPGTDPLKASPGNPYPGIAGFAYEQGRVVNSRDAGQTQIDVIDNGFVMPSVLRTSVALDYTDRKGFKYSIEGLYTKTLRDVVFRQINLKDVPAYHVYDTALELRKQPVFSGSVDPRLANAYELGNTGKGYRYSVTAQVSNNFSGGLNFSAAYTYGVSKDISNGIRNSMESNWQLNQALNPNNPVLAYSNFDIRHRIVVTIGYNRKWSKALTSHISLLITAQSGSPFTYGFVNFTPQNTPQQVGLAYIPAKGETVRFFAPIMAEDGTTVLVSPQAQADAFDSYIDSDKYLRSRRGDFTERNTGRTPWNNNADLHLAQDFHFNYGKEHTLTLSLDIMNLTNLISKEWGIAYFSPNTYNSTVSVGLQPYVPGKTSQGYPLYQFVRPGKPYSIDPLASRWQMQLGVRYSF